MTEKQTLTIVVALEPKQWNDKTLWPVVDSDGTEWTIWEEKVATAVRERLTQPILYEVSISQKGDKTYRSIQGIPGVVEREKKPGGSKSFTPRDPIAEARASAPTMVLSYVKDCIVGGILTPAEALSTADKWHSWVESKLGAAPKQDAKTRPTATQDAGGAGGNGSVSGEVHITEPSAPSVQASPGTTSNPPGMPRANPATASTASLPDENGLTPAEKAEAIPLRGQIKRLDPQENFVTHSDLNGMKPEELRQVVREINAALATT